MEGTIFSRELCLDKYFIIIIKKGKKRSFTYNAPDYEPKNLKKGNYTI